jgi:S1-C subfamily serine protease
MSTKLLTTRWAVFSLFATGVVAVLAGALRVEGQVPDAVLKAEAERIAVIEKVKPAVVAIFGAGGKGGGSGVLVSDDGYALTNFHVVAGPGPIMQCGLPDGILYDAVLVGLDKVGDVALIKLLPKKDGQKFPHVVLGDSDKVREGDWSLAMGNPFLLATDFTPTVTYGLISGVHRYQYPSGVLLEYTDCIQIDTSINPGNSGGPLFNMKGELIGINGRGSFDKRPRINSGVGYAISINQIKNFKGHLMSGLDVDHATPGFAVTTQTDSSGLGRMQVTNISDKFDVYRRGLRYGDELVSFDGRPIFSVNHLKNVLGLFPRGWRVPMEYRRSGDEEGRKEIAIRLMGVQRKVIEDPSQPKGPGPKKGPPKINQNSPAAKYYIAKEGFANYYFNKQLQDELLTHVKNTSDFAKLGGRWEIEGTLKFYKLNSSSPFKAELAEEKNKVGSVEPVVRLKVEGINLPYELFPNNINQKDADFLVPEGSGGMLAVLYVYRQLLTKGAKAFGAEFVHGGDEPFYPGDRKLTYKERKKFAEVVSAKSGPYAIKFYFDLAAKDRGKLVLCELRMNDEDDPCEIYFENYRQLKSGQWMPHRMTIVHADTTYCILEISGFTFEPDPK